ERHHQPDDRDRRGLPHPGGMREDDVALERGEIGALDADAGELAETGVDAIDRLTTRDDALDRRRPRLDRGQAGRIELRRRTAPDRLPRREGNVAGPQGDGRFAIHVAVSLAAVDKETEGFSRSRMSRRTTVAPMRCWIRPASVSRAAARSPCRPGSTDSM